MWTSSRTGKSSRRAEPDREAVAMIYVDVAVCSIGVISSVVAAVLWFYASHIKVPDKKDTFIGELQRVSRWYARAAVAFGIAALCAAYICPISAARTISSGDLRTRLARVARPQMVTAMALWRVDIIRKRADPSRIRARPVDRGDGAIGWPIRSPTVCDNI